MKDEIITIKCPYCSAVLKVRNCSGIENKYITCPVCQQRSLFRFYKRLSPFPGNEDKLQIDSIMHSYIAQVEERSGNSNISQPRQYFHIEQPFSISVITLNEDNPILFKITNKSHPRDIQIDNDQLNNIRARIKELVKSRKFDNMYYLCPQCGNVMEEIDYPRETGDDRGCECPVCKNQFYFGGTVLLDTKITYLTEISSNPIMLARKTYITKTKLIAKKLQMEVYLIDKVRLIMNYSEDGWKVTHITVLNQNE